ncbi:molybdate transport system ATP-binding protein [Asanoa hainanensis]|uniref:Molybdate transport system ATP-binding protein n=1 Tax=Asanoa hainanensis TaxID=560556 RepID=A0A239PHJ7_9ACTN|nr:ATP-binding cassette domain-containing protein [Asanoa hainanensis]SNT66265.1 molybdate transport system ATP-binding protein [Asanoa hainanensis]
MTRTPALAVTSLSVLPHLADVNLTLPLGARMAVVCEPPAGRLLLEVFAGIQRPDTGRIVVGETPLAPTGPAQALARIQTVGETPRPLRAATVAATLHPAARRARTHLRQVAGGGLSIEDLVDDALVRVGLRGAADQPPQTLSRQRRYLLDLAGALLHRPAVLLLERPAATLSTWGQRRLLDALADLPEHVAAIATVDHPHDGLALGWITTTLQPRQRQPHPQETPARARRPAYRCDVPALVTRRPGRAPRRGQGPGAPTRP